MATARKATQNKTIRVGSAYDDKTDATEEFHDTAAFDGSVSDGDGNVLADLKEILGQDVTREDTIIPVPNRPGLSVAYTKDIDFDIISETRRKAGMKGQDASKFNELKFMTIILSHTCKDILVRGRSTGYKFTSREFHDMVGAALGGTQYAIRKLFGADGHLLQIGGKVLEEAGYSRADLDLDGDEDGPLDD